MKIEEKLSNLYLKIPEAPNPVGAYVAYKKISNLLFISGQISIDDKGKIIKGKLGKDLSTEEGKNAAKLCAINIIAQAKKACNGKLGDILNCIKLINLKLLMVPPNLLLQCLGIMENILELQ